MTETMGAAAARFAGARVPRVEDLRLVTGQGTYVDDVSLPGMLHCHFVRSPFARARIEGIDTTAALELPGVHAVLLGEHVNPGAHEQWHTPTRGAPETPTPPLAEDEVRFVGDPVALVIAENRYVAEDAAELVDVEYDLLDAIVDYTTAEHSSELVHEAHGSNVCLELPGPPAEAVEAAFEGAAHVVRRTIRQHGYRAVPMETRGIVMDWSAATGELTIWASTQVPHEVRAFAARLLDLPEHHIRVIMRDTGGGFGQKSMVQREDAVLLLAVRQIRRPLKWVEDRAENLMAAGSARREHADVAVGLDADGKLLGSSIDFVTDVGAYPRPSPLPGAISVGMLFPGPYRLPVTAYDVKLIYSNTAGRSPYRGPWQFETVAREVLLDIAAREAGIDPIELRRINLLRSDELPFANGAGFSYDHSTPLETFEAAVEALDLDDFRRRQAAALAEGRYLGVGTSTYIEPTTAGFGVYATEGATIRIEPSGKVNVYVSGGSAGNSIETTVVQLVADELGVDVADVHTIQGDTALTPLGGGTCGSRSGGMIAGAVAETAGILRDRLKQIAAHRLEADVDDLELGDGGVYVRGTPSANVPMAKLAATAYYSTDKLPPGVPAGLEASGRYKNPNASVWANATHVCTCEVDVETGQVTLLRYIVGEDCGPMINPNVVEGQIAGGTVQGIGGALFEEFAYDEAGNPLTTTFADYLLPTAAEVPEIEYVHVVSPGPGPGGYKGVGEGGAIGAPPAVINAVADALAPLGVSITDQPLSPSRLLDLIDEAQAD